MEEDFSELEGKEVKVTDDVQALTTHVKTGIVVGIERDIGISIVDKHDSDNYLVCLIGNMAPQWNDKYCSQARSDALFDHLVKAITKGEIVWSEMMTLFDEYSKEGSEYAAKEPSASSADACAFGQ